MKGFGKGLMGTELALVSVLALGVLNIGLFAHPARADHSNPNRVFQTGDVFVAVGNGQVQWRAADGNLIHTLDTGLGGFTTGMAFDANGNLYVTNFDADTVSIFDNQGMLIGTFGSGYNCNPESIVFDANGNAYVGLAGCRRDILKFDSAGNFLARFNVAKENMGSDWIDLSDSGCLFYTSEGVYVKRFDALTNTQFPDFNPEPLPGPEAYALTLLPDGGLLVANQSVITRLDAAGNPHPSMPVYDVPGEDWWFAVTLDPEVDKSFWAANFVTANVYKFDMNSRNVLLTFNTGTGSGTVFGLAVFGVNEQKPQRCTFPPPLEGRMTGGGSIFTQDGMRITYSFELHCDANLDPNTLQVKWGKGNEFKLENLTSVSCSDDPNIGPNPPAAGFDTYQGTGTGRYNGISWATAEWTFTDAGEPGTNDFANIVIKDAASITVLSVSGPLINGNHQVHAK